MSNIWSTAKHDCRHITISNKGSKICFDIYSYYINREYTKKDIQIGLLSTFVAVYWLFANTNFIPQVISETQYYMLPLLLFIPVVILLIWFDYHKIEIKNKHFFSNLIVIACVVGILQSLWQINSCRYSYGYTKLFINKLKNVKEPVVMFTSEDQKNPCFVYDICFGTLQRSVLLSPDYKVSALVFPIVPQFAPDCMSDTFYNESSKKIHLQTTPIDVVNKYWDLTKIKPVIEELRKTGTIPDKNKKAPFFSRGLYNLMH